MVRAAARQDAGGRALPDRDRVLGLRRPPIPTTRSRRRCIASALGYATVGVNMRGSGCSGGVFDLFDLPTTADGYDVVETVAAQPWVQGGKVGMVGISFPGISQLFVAGARPPHLAAIAPLSVIADIYRAPGFPGGIFNNGFAESWLDDREDDAEPAPGGGQAWAQQRVMRRRRDLPRQPEAAPADAGPDRVHRRATRTTTPAAHGPSLADQLGGEDQGADLPLRRLAGRADRRRLRLHARRGSRSGAT